MQTRMAALNYIKAEVTWKWYCISFLLQIYEAVLFFHGAQKNDFDSRWKSFHAVKMALQDDVSIQ